MGLGSGVRRRGGEGALEPGSWESLVPHSRAHPCAQPVPVWAARLRAGVCLEPEQEAERCCLAAGRQRPGAVNLDLEAGHWRWRFEPGTMGPSLSLTKSVSHPHSLFTARHFQLSCVWHSVSLCGPPPNFRSAPAGTQQFDERVLLWCFSAVSVPIRVHIKRRTTGSYSGAFRCLGLRMWTGGKNPHHDSFARLLFRGLTCPEAWCGLNLRPGPWGWDMEFICE